MTRSCETAVLYFSSSIFIIAPLLPPYYYWSHCRATFAYLFAPITPEGGAVTPGIRPQKSGLVIVLSGALTPVRLLLTT